MDDKAIQIKKEDLLIVDEVIDTQEFIDSGKEIEENE